MKLKDLKPPVLFILGAGFTQAFVPKAPLLLVDQKNLQIQELKKKYKKFPNALKLLNSSIDKNNQINIEELLSRLSAGTPYDSVFLDGERSLLLEDIKSGFFKLIREAQLDEKYIKDLNNFSTFVIENSISCITFNYDTFLDESLFKFANVYNIPPNAEEKYWHPDGGYGFFLRPDQSLIGNTDATMDRCKSLLLKLHGSLNWRIKRGFQKSYPIDSLVHHEDWFQPPEVNEPSEEELDIHLETSPFVVPPIFDKSELNHQPILKVVWSAAFKKLVEAKTVVFIGYSLPKTDIAAKFLFKEGLQNKNPKNIFIVSKKGRRKEKINSYKGIVKKELLDSQFYFKGTSAWIREFIGNE
jgi:hypothetical protein